MFEVIIHDHATPESITCMLPVDRWKGDLSPTSICMDTARPIALPKVT